MGKEPPSSEELIRQVKQLQEKLRQLEAAAAQGAAGTPPGPCAENPADSQGLAESLVTSLGKLVPGLGKLIDVASQVPEFHKRLAAIDEEVRRKFHQQPLDGATRAVARSLGAHRVGIPPQIRRRPRRAGGSGRKPDGAARKHSRADRTPAGPRMHISPQTPAQLVVDVFDEGAQIVLLAEAPGLAPPDVSVGLEGTVVVITVRAPHRQGTQRVELPCEVVGQAETSLANGILRITLTKAEPS